MPLQKVLPNILTFQTLSQLCGEKSIPILFFVFLKFFCSVSSLIYLFKHSSFWTFSEVTGPKICCQLSPLVIHKLRSTSAKDMLRKDFRSHALPTLNTHRKKIAVLFWLLNYKVPWNQRNLSVYFKLLELDIPRGRVNSRYHFCLRKMSQYSSFGCISTTPKWDRGTIYIRCTLKNHPRNIQGMKCVKSG